MGGEVTGGRGGEWCGEVTEVGGEVRGGRVVREVEGEVMMGGDMTEVGGGERG